MDMALAILHDGSNSLKGVYVALRYAGVLEPLLEISNAGSQGM